MAVELIATTSPVFFAGKLINGFMIGTIGTIMISYIGEVCYTRAVCPCAITSRETSSFVKH